jgi:O-antigen ligase
LGVGDNMSDFKFLIDSTWTSIKLEWIFILAYIGTYSKLPSLHSLWSEYKFVTLITILWISTVLLSYFMSPLYNWQNSFAMMRLIEIITHTFFFLFIWNFFTKYTIDYRIVFTAVILSTLVVMCYFIYIHFAFPNLEADKHVFSIRSNQLILNTHLHRVGYQVETAIALITAFIFFKKQRIIALVIMGILFVFLFWLGGRASIIGIITALTTFLLYLNNRYTLKHLLLLLALILPFIYIISYLYEDLGYLGNALQKTFHAGSIDHLTSGRIQLWSLVLDNLQGHWLLGTGLQSYFFYPLRVPEVIHAHNFILQFLGEWGIVGTGLFLILLYKAIKYGIVLHLKKSPITDYFTIAAGITILALSITGLFSGVFFYHQTVIYLLLSLAIWITPSQN